MANKEIEHKIFNEAVSKDIKFYDTFFVIYLEKGNRITIRDYSKIIGIEMIYDDEIDRYQLSIIYDEDDLRFSLCSYNEEQFNMETDQFKMIFKNVLERVIDHFIPYIERCKNAKLDKLKRLAAIDDKLQAIVYAPDSSLFQEIKAERDKLVEKSNPV